MSVSRRRLLVAGRTGLLGLAGVAFVVAGRTATESLPSDAKQRKATNRKGKKRDQQHQHAKGPRHHRRKKKGGKGKGTGKGVHLRTGSVLPEHLISEKGGRLYAHMLLPFESFATEAQLAEAVAKAEELNLFVLPQSSGASPAA